MSGDASRSLGRGSCPPGPVSEGVIRIYSMRFCPYSHRACLVLKAKGIRKGTAKLTEASPKCYPGSPTSAPSSLGVTLFCFFMLNYVQIPQNRLPGTGDIGMWPSPPVLEIRHLTKECLVALRCGRDCADLKTALRQEFCNLEEVWSVCPVRGNGWSSVYCL
ncbi:hypothetical protein U0070_010930 [Myodes glareolus]|uniref:Uncharacterized protein n=1 Tax=Myodes glareolus TaxID=447135 RepID=A0AAW0H0C8_MYOGA